MQIFFTFLSKIANFLPQNMSKIANFSVPNMSKIPDLLSPTSKLSGVPDNARGVMGCS